MYLLRFGLLRYHSSLSLPLQQLDLRILRTLVAWLGVNNSCICTTSSWAIETRCNRSQIRSQSLLSSSLPCVVRLLTFALWSTGVIACKHAPSSLVALSRSGHPRGQLNGASSSLISDPSIADLGAYMTIRGTNNPNQIETRLCVDLLRHLHELTTQVPSQEADKLADRTLRIVAAKQSKRGKT